VAERLRRVVLASNNAGKLRELAALLAPLGLALEPQSAFGVPEAEEPFATFVENALAKARHASGGRPGVMSARWAARGAGASAGTSAGTSAAALDTDASNNAQLVADLAGCAERAAHYYCVLVLLRAADDPQPLIADASWHGEVIDTPRGSGGFGYDPHFLLPELGCTAAELDPQRKNLLGHRGQALRLLVERLRRDRLVDA